MSIFILFAKGLFGIINKKRLYFIAPRYDFVYLDFSEFFKGHIAYNEFFVRDLF